MINFTQSLYKDQWLDLVFKNRNKAYGAYVLRKHNAETTVKAFVLANMLFIGTILSPLIYNKITGKNVDLKTINNAITTITEVQLYKIKDIKVPALKSEIKQIKLKTIQNPQVVIAPANQVTAELPTQSQLTEAVIGSVTSEGEISQGANPIDLTAQAGNTLVKTEDTEIYNASSIEVYPEFPGGQAAFVKYLSRNLRYPDLAVERDIQGKIVVSFIIEKNGQLSNIQILRGIGYGCDEEAIRVLKKSPKWKPGRQNQQSVRVSYIVPINFQLPD